jgi:hypothetical protein
VLETFVPSIDRTSLKTGPDLKTTRPDILAAAHAPVTEQSENQPTKDLDQAIVPVTIEYLKPSATPASQTQVAENAPKSPNVVDKSDSTEAVVKISSPNLAVSPEGPRRTVFVTSPVVTRSRQSTSADTTAQSALKEKVLEPVDAETSAFKLHLNTEQKLTEPEITSEAPSHMQVPSTPSVSVDFLRPDMSRERESSISGLDASKTVSPESARVGDTLHWVITIHSTARSAIVLDRIEDPLDPNLRFVRDESVSADVPQELAAESGSVLVWATGCALEPGQIRRFTFKTILMK